MVDFRAMEVGYARGFQLAIEPMALAGGEIVAVVGPSGSGKSTFLHAIAGVLDLPSPATFAVPVVSNYVMHEPHLLPWRRIRGHIEAEISLRGQPFSWDAFHAHLATVGLDRGVLELRPRQLSLGMRQRIEFLIGLAFGANLLLGDEVFSGIDQQNKQAMMEIAVDYMANDQRILLFTSHFPVDVLRLATHVMSVGQGKVKLAPLTFYSRPSSRVQLSPSEIIRMDEFEAVTRLMS